jgi:hypothetical protein
MTVGCSCRVRFRSASAVEMEQGTRGTLVTEPAKYNNGGGMMSMITQG